MAILYPNLCYNEGLHCIVYMGERFSGFFLNLGFPQKVSLKMPNQRDHNSLSDLFSVCLRTLDHLNLKL